MALGGKPGTRTLISPSAVWPAEPHTTNSRGEHSISTLTKPSVATCIYIIYHKCVDQNSHTQKGQTSKQNPTNNQTNNSLRRKTMIVFIHNGDLF